MRNIGVTIGLINIALCAIYFFVNSLWVEELNLLAGTFCLFMALMSGKESI